MSFYVRIEEKRRRGRQNIGCEETEGSDPDVFMREEAI
jgi:hypothetical protein